MHVLAKRTWYWIRVFITSTAPIVKSFAPDTPPLPLPVTPPHLIATFARAGMRLSASRLPAGRSLTFYYIARVCAGGREGDPWLDPTRCALLNYILHCYKRDKCNFIISWLQCIVQRASYQYFYININQLIIYMHIQLMYRTVVQLVISRYVHKKNWKVVSDLTAE